METMEWSTGGSNGVGRPSAAGDVRRLLIEAGEVACPQRGGFAARRCFTCSWFAGADLDPSAPAIRCGFRRALVVDAPGPLGIRLARAWQGGGSRERPPTG